MIISEKQIMQLITIAHAHTVICFRFGALEKDMKEIQKLLADINEQQSKELKVVE